MEKVNHPNHYNNNIQPLETIQMMEKIYGSKATFHFCVLNSFKYRQRAGLKDDASQDLNKALWYENYAQSLLPNINEPWM